MNLIRGWLTISFANILLIAGTAIFTKAFFPYKPFLPGLATYDSSRDNPAPAQFDKLVFMLIDALRSDFVFSNQSSFHFTQSLISSGHAIPFTAHATSPTVTMPRVKALTTGSIPGFLDMILNIAESDTSSTLASHDNWLAQIKHQGKKLNMFGDDTWLKLFPGVFSRHDGTTSFFVSDFTEVDNNVTRHIDDELAAKDWDVTILHYLGLDHIGHKGGPRSSHMQPKQSEMDNIVKRIYQAIESEAHLESTLFVLCGDHGMNDVGNHGGSSAGETSAAFLFMSPKLESIRAGYVSPQAPRDDFTFYSRVEQSDLAPTLASLLRFPIPKNNLGLVLEPFLGLWQEKDQVEVVLENAHQLLKLLTASHSGFLERVAKHDCKSIQNDIAVLACAWQNIQKKLSTSYDSGEMLTLLLEFNRKAQKHLASAATNYNLPLMFYGVGTIFVGLLSLFTLDIATLRISSASIEIAFFWAVTITYGIMMFASSYVEEEQLFWYWITSAWCFISFARQRQAARIGLRSLIVFALLRITRRWNQTGQKHAAAPDIAKTFLTNRPTLLWILIFATYGYHFRRLRKYAFRQVHKNLALLMASVPAVTSAAFKLCMADLDAPELIPGWLSPIVRGLRHGSVVDKGRAAFVSLASVLIYTIFMEWRKNIIRNNDRNIKIVHTLISLLLITQSRLVNIPLFLIFQIILSRLPPSGSILSTSITTLLVQHVSFYALGNSNAISSIDLSNAYNGVGNYNVNIVGILTFISNWAGPIWWTSAGTLLRQRQQTRDHSTKSGIPFARHVAVLTAFRVVVMIFVTIACIALRTHLFIWTVFSPKFLFAIVWCVSQHLVIDIGLGGVLEWVRRRGSYVEGIKKEKTKHTL